jgi:hypothetical protein
MAGRRRLIAGAPRMLGNHQGRRGKWYREVWTALQAEFGHLDGLRRLEAGRVALAWVQLRVATEAMEDARRRAVTGLGRRPGPRDLERLARRQGLADASYSQALAGFTERMRAQPRKPKSGMDLLRDLKGPA